jgi:predicted TIM-barrel fold metal-dependent hydrolase
VVFGSDGPVSSPVLERHKVIIAGLSEQDTALVLGGNAESLLGLAA